MIPEPGSDLFVLISGVEREWITFNVEVSTSLEALTAQRDGMVAQARVDPERRRFFDPDACWIGRVVPLDEQPAHPGGKRRRWRR